MRLACDAVGARTAATIVPVHTKADLIDDGAPRDSSTREARFSYVSAETGEGLSAMLARIDAVLAESDARSISAPSADAIVITRERHQRGLREARDEITRFLEGWSSGELPATVAAVHLQSARDALAELVGAIGTEEILDRVFAEFCIGK